MKASDRRLAGRRLLHEAKKLYTAPAKKKQMPTELMGQYGLTNAEANAMSPEKLFGMLMPELKLNILTSGTKVGLDPYPLFQDRYNSASDALSVEISKLEARRKVNTQIYKDKKLTKGKMIEEIESISKENRRTFHRNHGYDIPAKGKAKAFFLNYLVEYKSMSAEYTKADKAFASTNSSANREKAISDQEDIDYKRDIKRGATKPSRMEIDDYKRSKDALSQSLRGRWSGKGYERAKKEAIAKFNKRYRTLELYLKQNPSAKLI